MEILQQKIAEFMNSPVGVALTTCIGLLVSVLVLFSKTSLGKKLFNQLVSNFNKVKEMSSETLKVVKETKEFANSQVELLKSEYDKKLLVFINYTEQLENLLYRIGEITPNQKIKNLIDNFKDEKNNRLQAISEYVNISYEKYQEIVLESENVENEIKDRVETQIATYESLYNEKLKELDELIEKYKRKVEELYEGKENTDTTIEIL